MGHGADVEVLDGLGGQREEAGPEAVAAVGLPVGEAVLPEGAQQAERGALVHAELLGHLAEPGRTPREQRQDPQRPLHRLAHAVPLPFPLRAPLRGGSVRQGGR